MLVERQIPVRGFAQHGLGSRNGTARVDQFGGRKVLATALTLVTVGVGVAAVGAFAHNVAVGQEGVRLFVVFLHKFALVVERAEEVRRHLAVGGTRGARIDVERDAETFETVLDELVIAVHHFLNAATFFARTDSYGNTVLVRSADEKHIAVTQTEVAGIDVGGYVNTGEVADVHTAVGVG